MASSFYFSPASIYLLKVNNENTRTKCETCSKLIIKTPEQRQWCRSSVFNINFEQIFSCLCVSIIDLEQSCPG